MSLLMAASFSLVELVGAGEAATFVELAGASAILVEFAGASATLVE